MPCGSGPDKLSTSQRAEQCSVDGDSELPATGELKRALHMHHSEGVFLSPLRVGCHDTSHLFMDLMFVSPKIHILKPSRSI